MMLEMIAATVTVAELGGVLADSAPTRTRGVDTDYAGAVELGLLAREGSAYVLTDHGRKYVRDAREMFATVD